MRCASEFGLHWSNRIVVVVIDRLPKNRRTTSLYVNAELWKLDILPTSMPYSASPTCVAFLMSRSFAFTCKRRTQPLNPALTRVLLTMSDKSRYPPRNTVVRPLNPRCVIHEHFISPVSIQTQSLALRERKPQETQALALASSQSWLPLLRPNIPNWLALAFVA